MQEKHCKWYNDEFCTNGDSPCVADYCPVVEYPELCKYREVDKDINVRSKTELNDEEIAKAILQNIEYSSPITYIDEWGNCKDIMLTDILDLIHSLKENNGNQVRMRCDMQRKFDDLQNLCIEQKAEIERLKEVNAGLALANLCDLQPNEDCLTDNEFEVARKTITEQKAEIERLNKCVMSEEQIRNCCADIIQGTMTQALKETAEKFAEMLKRRLYEYCEVGVSYDEFCEANVICGDIDEICKGITEEK